MNDVKEDDAVDAVLLQMTAKTLHEYSSHLLNDVTHSRSLELSKKP